MFNSYFEWDAKIQLEKRRVDSYRELVPLAGQNQRKKWRPGWRIKRPQLKTLKAPLTGLVRKY